MTDNVDLDAIEARAKTTIGRYASDSHPLFKSSTERNAAVDELLAEVRKLREALSKIADGSGYDQSGVASNAEIAMMADARPSPQRNPAMTLIERLESAEAGSRELDAAVEVAVRWEEARRAGLFPDMRARWRGGQDGSVTEGRVTYQSRRVTTDLSAAVALVERVLPGWKHIDYTYDADDPIYRHQYVLHENKHKAGTVWVNSHHRQSQAIALCIALLRAIEAREGKLT